MATVAVADGGGLLIDIKGVSRVGTSQQLEGLLLKLAHHLAAMGIGEWIARAAQL